MKLSKAELEAEVTRVAKVYGCDRGTFTVCGPEHERGEICRCKEEAKENLRRRAALSEGGKQ